MDLYVEGLELRRYRSSDHERVLQLHYQGLEQTGVRTNDDFYEEYDADLTRIEEEYLNDGDFIIATVNDEIVGMGVQRVQALRAGQFLSDFLSKRLDRAGMTKP